MALTQEEEKQIRELLQQQDQQKRKSVLSSKENLKRWLSSAASHIAGKVVGAAFDMLLSWLVSLFC
ncbi:hypothetical protein AmaxDRAFT_3787 [Limnospira maxima CS-328]|uniref:Uncharacterized protein n=1 Tax=Limnospira maxima CS-328 TaxID=513049 RepID=B5W4T9_LIMMA|nr:hypothetical protein [Limnospira maxima]EDZ93399.1 hypothetical protein AmaxDRAFT_3787 [Limnospira maxima CS-328]MDC0836479.1 hypothetical protein [Limnoraphis robusta]